MFSTWELNNNNLFVCCVSCMCVRWEKTATVLKTNKKNQKLFSFECHLLSFFIRMKNSLNLSALFNPELRKFSYHNITHLAYIAFLATNGYSIILHLACTFVSFAYMVHTLQQKTPVYLRLAVSNIHPTKNINSCWIDSISVPSVALITATKIVS